MDGTHVLLVEDSRTYATAMTRRLEDEYGMVVTHCDSLQILTAKLQEERSKYSIALVDLNLPDAPNGEALDYVLSMGIPAIVFTGTFSEQTRDAVLAKQVADYVLKDGPEAMDHLINATIRVLSNREFNILVVDDISSTRELLSTLLRRQLYQVTAVDSGEAALEALAVDTTINLAIIDHQMPSMDGIKLVREIRKQSVLDQLRIIGISSAFNRQLTTLFLKAGANDFIHRPFLMEEFYWRVAQNVRTTQLVRRLYDIASQDYLTGLYNRRQFFVEGPRRVHAIQRTGRSQAMAIMDIDHFKRLNDTYGHEIGDVVLKAVSQRLKSICGSDHLIARIGGEEFGVLISGLEATEAKAFCERLRIGVEELDIPTDDGDINVTISIGLAEIIEIESFDNYLHAADQFLYMAKHAGRNCVYTEMDISSKTAA